tara:strand:- start:4033 stop:4344 length:312 start_codon:yes stop_codon:yes gene_type:complete
MLDKEELFQVLEFVSNYWIKLKKEPENEAFKVLPSKFWMKSLGGPVGNHEKVKGRWITTLMYVEDEQMEQAFRDVLARWQAKGQQTSTELPTKSPDLIQIKRG